jgi:ribosomal protein S27E
MKLGKWIKYIYNSSRKFVYEGVLTMEAQKKMRDEESFGFDEEPSEAYKQAEQVALAAYFTIEMPDEERLILIESYCKTCKSKTIRVFSSKTRRLVCTGCGRELAKL